jgi:predicted DsbA family dithiol-disulfide isomerase
MANVKTALVELGMDCTVEKVTDFAEIAKYGVMSIPALVIDEKIVSFGKVLKAKEIARILEDAIK